MQCEGNDGNGYSTAERLNIRGRYRSSNTTIWVNKTPDGTIWKNFKVEKLYKKNDRWQSSSSFTETELLELKEARDKAISEETVKKN